MPCGVGFRSHDQQIRRDGRQSIAELARAVHMSNSAVAERVRRPEEGGVIRGYRAIVDPERLGYGILEVLEAHHQRLVFESVRNPADRATGVTGRVTGLRDLLVRA
ncbi:Lrp/AsnC family transcriptional regulator [Diaminobutyricibacter sp. McL0608]|uniref:Lrp/AsnC family transcriptional regulator n=1 Tax=Leifsonia sp. McL0608 TaxID=3143537 RepID=UPI0031F31990